MAKTTKKTSPGRPKRKSQKSSHPDLVQAGKFSVVGVINTLIDFTVLNILNVLLGVPLIPANIAAATVAMTFSFTANRQLVFKPSDTHYVRQAVLFIVVTAFGLYVIQNLIIYGLTQTWTWPLDTAYNIVGALKLDGVFSHEFVFANGAKVVATVVTMIWNFVLYKKYVFSK